MSWTPFFERFWENSEICGLELDEYLSDASEDIRESAPSLVISSEQLEAHCAARRNRRYAAWIAKQSKDRQRGERMSLENERKWDAFHRRADAPFQPHRAPPKPERPAPTPRPRLVIIVPNDLQTLASVRAPEWWLRSGGGWPWRNEE